VIIWKKSVKGCKTMLENILFRTLAKVKAVNKYNQIELQAIPKAVDEGIKFNAMKFALDLYMKTVIRGKNNEQLPEDLINKNKAFIEDVVEILDITVDDNDVMTMKYKYKDKNFLGTLGFELDMDKADMEVELYIHLKYMQNYSILLQLVICFEFFITHVFRFLVTAFPDHYLKDQSVSFSQFIKMNHETIKEYLIENEVTKILWEGMPDWIKRLEKHKIDFSCMKTYIDEYYEINCRRNLIVHNDGIVNGIYLGCIENSDLQVGDKIYIDPEYLKRTCFIIQTLVYGITIELIKIDHQASSIIIDTIMKNAFEHLKCREWEICIFIYERLKCNKFLSAADKILTTINLWIAKKNHHGIDKIKKEIEEEDLSATQDHFQMAKWILLENYEKAEVFLESLFPQKIAPEHIETWPLFIQYRNTEYYTNFTSKHSDQFVIMTAPENIDFTVNKDEKEFIKALDFQKVEKGEE
jgi:hypothetical protein